ncbi:diguanylate cyclase [Pseudoduganella albidiflava]|uniref:diguanylate cyclase n=2 Tax=Pseudoduganella albidiflava TaxID=321983 RepID=A0A411X099_9BURK|nr:GGDEF domain-containing protein [Pseudoduganella albidiflava]GGY43338.1 diguanylate cyclase [Pseudoduganella albidiflava]
MRMTPYARLQRWLLYAAMVLVVGTPGLLVWHHLGMTRVLELAAGSGFPVTPVDDRGDGGTSTAKLVKGGPGIVLDCDVRKDTYQWPYCGYHFELGLGENGIDLSGFHSMTVDVTDAAPGKHGMRAYFRQFERGFSRVGEWQSQKVNEIEFMLPPDGVATVPLELLRTAPWWVSAREVPLLMTGVRIDNTTAIELYTGSREAPGLHRLTLKSLRLEGKWISQNALLLAIVVAWMLLGTMWLAARLLEYRAKLHSSKARVAALKVVNRALELETQELAGQAFTDSLTGALNRNGMREWLMVDDQARRECMGLIVVDLDHFKRINDGHGHAVGDEVLSRFAREMRARLRAEDRLVRWGGEEFLVLRRGASVDETLALAERLRGAMADIAWPSGLRVTASFGVTGTHEGEDIGVALHRADQALYIAKKNGRNRAECARDAQQAVDHGVAS